MEIVKNLFAEIERKNNELSLFCSVARSWLSNRTQNIGQRT